MFKTQSRDDSLTDPQQSYTRWEHGFVGVGVDMVVDDGGAAARNRFAGNGVTSANSFVGFVNRVGCW